MKISSLFLLTGIITVSTFFLFKADLNAPGTDSQRIAVITRYYGITAEEIERIITIPLEHSFSTLAGLEELKAYSEFSLSRIDMKLYADADNRNLISQLREKTDRIYSEISTTHKAVQKPQFVTSGSGQQAVFSAAISCPGMTATELRPVVENKIKPLYSSIQGLGEIDITGGSMHEIHVYVDNDKAASYGYQSSAIASVIRTSSVYIPCGSLDDGLLRIPVNLDAEISELEALRNIPISPDIKLSEVANIDYFYRKPESINRCNGKETIGLYIKSSAADLIRISKELRKTTAKLVEDGYKVEIINDRGSELKRSFNRVIEAIGIGIIISTLLLFVLGIDIKRLLFLVAGQSLIIITAAGVASAIGFSPESYLFAGFAIGIGMILDSSILITGALNRGINAYKKIMKPLISSTLSTLTALLPVIPLRAEIQGLASLLSALGIILIVSLVLSAAFLPGLYKPATPNVTKNFARLASARRKILNNAAGFISIRKSFVIYTALVTTGIISLTGLNIRINDPIETSAVFVHVECKSGESVESVDKKMSKFTKLISCNMGVDDVQSTSRRGGGSIVVSFKDTETDVETLMEQIKSEGRNLDLSIYFPENDSGGSIKLLISVTGDNTDELKNISRISLQKILQHPWAIDGVYHFKEDIPSYHFIPDSDSLYQTGNTAASVASYLRWNLQGPVAVKWQSAGKERDLRVMSDNFEILTSSDIASMKISQPGKSLPVRLNQLGSIVQRTESLRINRLNSQHAESFSVLCKKSDPVKINQQIWNQLEEQTLPTGYTFIPSTELIKKQIFYKRLWLQFGAALLLIIIMLCIERESFYQPLIIMMQLPPILAVPVIILRLIGAELGTDTIIGLTLLAGMGINNGILIIDNIAFGISSAVKLRFNSLFLTTATSVAGMIPLLFTGSAFFQIIAIVLISGLTASFFIAVYIFPSLLQCYLSQTHLHVTS